MHRIAVDTFYIPIKTYETKFLCSSAYTSGCMGNYIPSHLYTHLLDLTLVFYTLCIVRTTQISLVKPTSTRAAG